MKQKITMLLMLLFSLSAYSQHVAEVRGNVIDGETQKPLVGVSVTLKGQNLSGITDLNGEFVFRNVLIGDDYLLISSMAVEEISEPVTISKSTRHIGTFEVQVKQQSYSNVDTEAFVANLDDLDLDGESGGAQNVSSLILMSDDPYLSIASYQFSSVRLKSRGYASKYEKRYLSGIEFNDQIRGTFSYSSIGALNDMTRNGNVLNYWQPGSFSFGSFGGAQDINLRPSANNKGGTLRASYSNGYYYLRGMASYSTGLMDNGWAFSGLLGGRYSDEGFVDGSFYHNMSYFLSAEKQWDGGKHSLSLTTFGSPVQRAMNSAITAEAAELTGDYFYNPDWGYQDGKKRNARIVTAYDPTAILSYIYNVNNKTKLTNGISFNYSNYGKTALNWYGNAKDPRPDYYRNLPSYRTSQAEKELYTDKWRSKDRSFIQINWDDLYETNQLALNHPDPNMRRETPLYMVEDRKNNVLTLSYNGSLETKLSQEVTLMSGVGVRWSKGHNYKVANDMLGGDWVYDIDKFAERDAVVAGSIEKENDLNNIGRKIHEGDKFGYNYDIDVRSENLWIQNQHQYNKFDLYYGAKISFTEFYRKGKMRNGRNPENSYGKGKVHSFVNQSIKAGATYKLDGRNFFVANLAYGTEAPLAYDAYIAPRVKDTEIPNLENERYWSAELGYVFSFPKLRGRFTAYQTNFYDQTQKTSYFNDVEGTYLHHVMTNVNKVHRGLELGLEYKPTSDWTLSFAGTLGEYYYANNPDGTQSWENNLEPDRHEKVHIKNFYVGSTPQYAATFGIQYFYKYWFLGANLNGFARSYLDPTPVRRVNSSFANFPSLPIDEAEELFDNLVRQTKLKGGMTLDLSIGKLLFLKNGHSVNFNLSIKNVLDYEKMQTGGYEQGRIDKQYYKVEKFPAKFYYMQGINGMLNIAYKFN